ncbi:tyrosine-type recombinase/integrase [Lentzea sp. NPDC004782]|uniref:tyrosine-type recombinase/integrase n=1 Tax=Lentzea sp. NPDC004782 TaxID=3154458 RepID=UPI0033A79972
MKTSYKVKIYAIDVYRGKRTTTYWVQWSVAGERYKEPYKEQTQAENRQSELKLAASKGEAFCTETGLPVSEVRKQSAEMSWYDFVRDYIDMKWDGAAPKHRKSIADALAPITEAMITSNRGRPEHNVLRRAMRVLFNKERRNDEHPQEITAALGWLAQNTRAVSDLAEPDVLRQVVSRFEKKVDGKRAARDTIRLRRTTFNNALKYAWKEKKLLDHNPMTEVETTKRKSVIHQVDRRSVANPIQFRTVLTEVRKLGRTGRMLVLFFALMYFAALRPEEASNLRLGDVTLPPRVWNEDEQKWEVREWGDIHLAKASPEVGAEWTDSGEADEERELKHREEDDGRPVPLSPELALIVYEHVDEFGTGPDGHLVVAPRGGRIGSSTYCRIWDQARTAAFTASVAASLLAKRPYDLRHACVSFWLNAGVEATRVAEWAGHSLAVLLRVYAKCIDGGERSARQRVQDAFGRPPMAA